MSDNPLESYFNFDQVDLAANRRGQLSPKQKERLVNNENSNQVIYVAITIVAVLITLIPLSIILYHLMNASMDQVGLGLVIWTLIGGIVSALAFRRAMGKVNEFPVQKIEGPVQIRAEKNADSGSDLDYYLQINGEVFDVDDGLADIMDSGDVYALYYLSDPHDHSAVEILSGEIIKPS